MKFDNMSFDHPLRMFEWRIYMPVFLVLPALIATVAAESNGPYIVSVDDIRELSPGETWNPDEDELLVEVRGYLRDDINLYLHATKDQALLDDISGVVVSDEGEGSFGASCSGGFVELVARVVWLPERRVALVPTKAKRLTLREKGPADEEICWEADLSNDR